MTAFDRELGLADLLPGPQRATLGGALAALLGGDAALLDTSGATLWGSAPAGATRVPLILELEPIGYLAAAADAPRLAAAARLLGELLRATLRYRMASALHVEAVAEDYEALKIKHAALQESEARYRQLSGQLEQRVREQVDILEERQRQLYQAERLASVGQLAAGVAHEINNPIGFIRSNLKTFGGYLQKFAALKARLRADAGAWKELDLDFLLDDGRDLVKDSVDGADRIARIVRDLRGFSNIDRPEEEMADLNVGLRDACAVISGQKPPGVVLTLELQPLPPILCLPGHLNQVFLNVLMNALQAVGERGEMRVASRRADGNIEVTIADDGVGIPPENLERVFEPFFTTREVGQGTGLGLTVARDIVNAHGGRIELDSAPGRGTTVRISLPT